MSNKMQTEQPEKTASAPKKIFRQRYFILIGLVVTVLIASCAGLVLGRTENCQMSLEMQGVGEKCIQLEKVSNRTKITKGLSGRENMPDNQGMLFVFDSPAAHCFWMKDMRFPLDIIWADANKKIVTIEENVQPDTYPNSFCPDQLALYVIEVNAGVSKRAGLAEGRQLQF